MTPDDIARLFTFHPPEGDEPARYKRITAAARHLAEEIVAVCPAGPETTLAIRSVMRARMDANAAIAVRKRDGSQPLPEISPIDRVLVHRDAVRAGEKWRHVKTNGRYTILAVGQMQDSDPALDYAHVVVYQSDYDGRLWVRGIAEFIDGRFVSVLP